MCSFQKFISGSETKLYALKKYIIYIWKQIARTVST